MLLSDFDYHLPPSLIAAEPASPRTAARMLDMRGPTFIDRIVADLPDCLNPGDLLVVNNTRVLPARLIGKRGEATINVTLHRRIDGAVWRGFAKPARKLKLGDQVVFSPDLAAEIDFIGADGERGFAFNHSGEALDKALEATGVMPLPPYIPRPDGVRDDDADHYQTMFAAHNGAVAAPTAGLHFTPELMADLQDRGVAVADVTLHVGAGTFLPVKVEDLSEHKMHLEWGEISAETAAAINRTKAEGGKVVAVGTTSLRILESCFRDHGDTRAYQAETDLFILPGFKFGVVDVLMTNFHLPKSTLLMLISAFTGKAHVDAAYAHAIAENYRFFSYGDACLMERRDD
ncbi:MAG: tRNA preQ1(34) S-adenosylmethionine ribosyltransferase-isomerase QueA [Alphaproteobacteria bacterium]|nr:tRNA preQ1(34) S-adenosylmethionine ribosyltransferase-isomerase QueA [Alphaproteobacteria bacterium]